MNFPVVEGPKAMDFWMGALGGFSIGWGTASVVFILLKEYELRRGYYRR
jgi:hypothetical protein